MTRIAIDGQVSELGPESNQKISDIVNNALTNLPANRIITKIMVDGQEVAAIPDLTEQAPTAAFRDLEIRTIDKEIWAINGIELALSSIEKVQRSLIRGAEMFREDDKATANRFFVQCIDGLEHFYEAVMISRSVLKLDFNAIEIDGLKLAQIENDFSGILRTIIELQEKADWAGLAEKIEFELITNLSFWTMALKQLRLSRMSNA